MVYTTFELVADTWRWLKGNRTLYVFFVSLLFGAIGLNYLVIFLMGKAVDYFVQTPSTITVFYWIIGAIALTTTIQVSIRFIAKYHINIISAKVRRKMREDAVKTLLDQELGWHESQVTGKLIQKVIRGSEVFYSYMKSLNNYWFRAIVNLVVPLVIFVTFDWIYVLMFILYAGIYFFGEWFFNKRLGESQEQLNDSREKVTGKLQESLSNVTTVKAMGLHTHINKYTKEQEEDYFSVWKHTLQIGVHKSRTIKIYSAIGHAAFLLVAGIQTYHGEMSIGTFAVFGTIVNMIQMAMHQITNNTIQFIAFKAAIGRIKEILVLEKKEDTRKEFPKNWKKIEFMNVSFKYQRRWVLKNFSLTIHRGQKIGLIGKSGKGKSTIIKLLLGLYEPQEGAILVDGKIVTQFNRSSITKHMGVVLQESELFSMSLKENITLLAKVSKPLFDTITNVAELQSVIKKMPQGEETLIGEKGYRVSGGERQRISIARALYQQKSLLILDEATSNLDEKTERRMIRKMNQYFQKQTVIAIAHRHSTLKGFDVIREI